MTCPPTCPYVAPRCGELECWLRCVSVAVEHRLAAAAHSVAVVVGVEAVAAGAYSSTDACAFDSAAYEPALAALLVLAAAAVPGPGSFVPIPAIATHCLYAFASSVRWQRHYLQRCSL